MQLPPAARAQVWLDFDGTMTQTDLLDELVLKYAVNDSWREVEHLWETGQIGSRQCLKEQFALVRIGDRELDEFLTTVQLDPGLVSLIKLLDRFDVPRAVMSDGIEMFIQRTLSRHNLSLPIRSNAIERHDKEIRLLCPLSKSDCSAAHCKCASITELGLSGRASIYVGDGRSDLCPARKADYVFAKGALAEALAAEGKSFTPFVTLLDVTETLRRNWQG